MNIRVLGTHLVRRWAVIMAAAAVTAVAVGAWSSTGDASYRASADVLLPTAAESTLIGQERLVEASAELAAATADEVTGITADDVSTAIEVSRTGTVLTIEATGPSPALVRDIANTHAAVYLDLVGPASLPGAELIRPADVPDAPVAPRPVRDGALGAVASLLPAAILTVWCSVRRDQIRSGADVRSTASVLAEIPLDEAVGAGGVGLPAAESPGVDYVVSIEGLCNRLLPSSRDRARRILVAGTDAGVETAELTANLGWIAAAAGWRTVVVGANGRVRRLQELLSPYVIDVPAQHRRRHQLDGLVAMPGAEGREHLAVAVAGDHVVEHLLPTRAPNLLVLPSLPGAADRDPGPLLSSGLVAASLDHLDLIADLVIVEAPAMSTSDDAVALATRVDDVVIVASAGSTTRRQLSACVRRLERDRPRVRGVVITKVRCSRRRSRDPEHRAQPPASDATGDLSTRQLVPVSSAAADSPAGGAVPA